MSGTRPEDRLRDLGYELPAAPAPVGAYVPVVKAGNFVVTSGQLPFKDGHLVAQGRVGDEVTVEVAQQAARVCLLNALAQVRQAVGELSKVRRIIRLEGYVHSGPGFFEQPVVLNPASELLTQVFGERGQHTRVALGIAAMPLNAPVQLALWVEVDSD